jgi:hypothetical protein
MRIDSSGKVGIGTTNTTASVHLFNSSSAGFRMTGGIADSDIWQRQVVQFVNVFTWTTVLSITPSTASNTWMRGYVKASISGHNSGNYNAALIDAIWYLDLNGGSGATTLTGYVKGTGTTAFTASSTIPNTDISGLGTMSTQNSNSVTVTGGTINGTSVGATTASTAAFTYISTSSSTSTTPTLSFNASNAPFAAGATISGSYLQHMLQNKSATAGASVNYVLSNDSGTDSTYYGEFGMNSSVFSTSTPADYFSINNGIYFSGHDGDVTIGSGNGFKSYFAWGTTGQSAHVINATGAIGLSTNLGTTPATSGTTGFGTSGQVLTSAGSSAAPTWTTPTAQTYPGSGIPNSTGSAWGTSYTTSGSGTVVALNNTPTLTNPTITNYVETLQAVGTVGSTSTLSLTSGTVLTATLTASTPCTFTMPTATAGKSFILKLTQASSGMTTATFTSVKWPSGTAPTITATASAVDIISFVSDGTNWYGTAAQAFA